MDKESKSTGKGMSIVFDDFIKNAQKEGAEIIIDNGGSYKNLFEEYD